MPSNRRQERRAQRLMGRARVLSRRRGETAHLYGEAWYAATTWSHRRRVIIKAEVVRHPGRAPKNNPRFVVTNLPGPPRAVYELYCQRGDVENRLKELHHGLEMDRTSCAKFRANQFRVLLTLAVVAPPLPAFGRPTRARGIAARTSLIAGFVAPATSERRVDRMLTPKSSSERTRRLGPY
jgi:Transposase DDE domain group 1